VQCQVLAHLDLSNNALVISLRGDIITWSREGWTVNGEISTWSSGGWTVSRPALSAPAPHRAEGGTEPGASAAARSCTTNVQGLAQDPNSLLLANTEAAAVAGAEEKEGEDTRVRRGWGQGGGMVEETMSLQEKGWERRSRKGLKHH
jgi:hypothetical protein